MSCVKSYGKLNNADLIQAHTVPFMMHISSPPVVKYLVVIRAYLFKWWGNIKYHRFSAETGQWLSTDVCQLGNVHRSVWLCVWERKPRWTDEAGAWKWRGCVIMRLIEVSHNVCTYKERKWVNKWDGKFGEREPWVAADCWPSGPSGLSSSCNFYQRYCVLIQLNVKCDILILEFSELINTQERWSLWGTEKWMHVNLPPQVSIKEKCIGDYLFYEVLDFALSLSCTACSSAQPVWLLGCLRVRSKVTWAQRNERWMTGRSPTPSPHVPPKTVTSLVPRGCSPTEGISHLKETLHQKKHIASCAKLH